MAARRRERSPGHDEVTPRRRATAQAEASPLRALAAARYAMILADVAQLKEDAAKKIDAPLISRIKEELRIEKIPTPLELSNASVVKEPWLLMLYAETHAVKECDLVDLHGESPAIIRGLRANLFKCYTTPEHPPNSWVTTMIESLVSHYTSMLGLYALVAPHDEAGRSMKLEASHVERLAHHLRKQRELARVIIMQLDENYARKNAGRAAAAVIHGARCLASHQFAPQDEWIYKKASSKVSTEWTPGGGAVDGGFDGGYRSSRGRGGRGGRGRGGRGRGGRPGAEHDAEAR